ncbi:MAG: hypothetical protein ABFC98_01345 [Candidatus Cloacimonas sp.]
MSMWEMVLALLAVVLFTSISLSYNQALWAQTDYLNNATLVVQANHICHSVLDEIDAKLFSKAYSFLNIVSMFQDSTNVVYYPHLKQSFTIKISAINSDSLGHSLPSPNPNSLFKTVTVTVSGPAALKHNVSLKRLYTKTNM